MAVDGVRIGAGQSPRRTCFQPGCFRGGGRDSAGRMHGGSPLGDRAGAESVHCASAEAQAEPLSCRPLTPALLAAQSRRDDGFYSVPLRGPPGATGERPPDRGRAFRRPAAGARCLRQHQGQRRQQRCLSFVPPPARPRGTKTSAAGGAGTPASPLPAPAPSPRPPAWPGVPAAHAPAPAHVALPPPPRHPPPRVSCPADPTPPLPCASPRRPAPLTKPARRSAARRHRSAPLSHTVPVRWSPSPPLPRNLRTLFF